MIDEYHCEKKTCSRKHMPPCIDCVRDIRADERRKTEKDMHTFYRERFECYDKGYVERRLNEEREKGRRDGIKEAQSYEAKKPLYVWQNKPKKALAARKGGKR